jgi:hypothetical protein
MSKRPKEDPLINEIRRVLMPGQYFQRDEVSELVGDLDVLNRKLEVLVKTGNSARSVDLYEVMLAGVYAKIEEADDECDLALLFHRLACGWIRARQAAGRPAQETVGQLLKWMKNDDYGFCYDIEKVVIHALDRNGRRLFIGHFQGLIQKAMPAPTASSTKAIFDFDNDVRLPALSLKQIYEAVGDAPAFAAVCEQLGISPRDCERLAGMEISKKHWACALEWVEKGIALEPARDWHNESSDSLKEMKPAILRHLGRKEDALALVWSEFQKHPGEFTYEELMSSVPRDERPKWHERAMAEAAGAGLSEFISLCVKTREWNRLGQRVYSVQSAELEALSHYDTEPAAKGLARKDPLAAAKVYRAMGLRILSTGKSKYYGAALDHFKKVRDLYGRAGQSLEWKALAEFVRKAHSRKSGFMADFEKVVSGKCGRSPSFAEQAHEQWERLTS